MSVVSLLTQYMYTTSIICGTTQLESPKVKRWLMMYIMLTWQVFSLYITL